MLSSLSALSSLERVDALTIGNTRPGGSIYAVNCGLALNNISGLSGLESLQRIGGFGSPNDGVVDVNCNPNLQNVDAIASALTASSLTRVTVSSNDSLTSLAGFTGVVGVAQSFEVLNNDQLGSLTGLDALTAVGSLTVANNDIPPSLAGLGELLDAGSQLQIVGNDQLSSLVGVDSLATAGILRVQNTTQLVTLEGLETLEDSGRGTPIRLDIRDNGGLESLVGLSGLQTASEILVSGNADLLSLSGLSSLQSADSLRVSQNDSLLSVDGVETLTTLEGLSIGSNPLVADLDGLSGLDGGICYVHVSLNDELLSIAGIGGLDEIPAAGCGGFGSYAVWIEGNAKLASLTGLEWLVDLPPALGNVLISGNDSLTDLTGLDNLRTVGVHRIGYPGTSSNTGVVGNAGLTSLAGLESLQTVTNTLAITGNDELLTLAALSNVGGELASGLTIYGNPKLTSLDGLDGLTSIRQLTLGGSTLAPADDLPLLADISALSGVTELFSVNLYNTLNGLSLAPLSGATYSSNGTRWRIRGCSLSGLVGIAGSDGVIQSLDVAGMSTPTGDLAGLEGLTAINGNFYLDATSLTNLNGLSGLTTVTGNLRLDDNDSLTSLAGFDNLETLGGSLTIRDHDVLPTCEADAFYNDLVANHGYGGTATITNNDDTGVCN